MRISDWSSDVCSSDLFAKPFCPRGKEGQSAAQCNWLKGVGIPTGIDTQENKNMKVADRRKQPPREKAPPLRLDRKSVVEGKSVSVRVVLGGRSSIKKKTHSNYEKFTFN